MHLRPRQKATTLKSMPDKRKESLAEVNASVDTARAKKGWRRLLAFMGPAYLVSVGYMDPGNWATDIGAGSAFGYQLIWVLLMSNVMALLLQGLCVRLGVVRKLDLAQASRATYPKAVNYALYGLAEIAIAATDLAEILGMAIGLQLLFGLPLLWGVSLTVLDTLLFLLVQHLGMRKMEAFILFLISIIGGAFVVELFLAKPDPAAIAAGFLPSIPNDAALYLAIGIIGATVMPHNLYLHSALVQTRKFANDGEGIRKAIRYNFFDSAIALNLAFFVNAAILMLAAAAFHQNGLFEVAEIQDAHKLLENLLGTKWAPALFAVALIAAGQSSTITGTLAGQIVMEGYLHLRIQPWLRRLITRLMAVVPAFLVILFFGEAETGRLLIFSQVILSLQLGFAIIPLIHLVSDPATMGEHVIGRWTKIGAWLIASVIIVLNAQLVINEVTGWFAAAGEGAWWLWLTVVPAIGLAAVLLLYLILKSTRSVKQESFSLHGPSTLLLPGPAKAYNRIALCLDFTDADQASMREAIQVGGTAADYLLIHVMESAGARHFGRDVADREASNNAIQLAAYVRQFREAGYRAEGILAYGSPRRELSRVATEGRADLVVMGAHGHNWLKDLLFGTTVEGVRHRVAVPVLVVGSKEH